MSFSKNNIKNGIEEDIKIILNDSIIRNSLKDYLKNIDNTSLIVDEFRIHNGNAIADLVSIKDLHCFEIKGDTDKIARIVAQCEYYDTTFSYSTLVTTISQLNKAIKYAPSHWGILVAELEQGVINFSYHRKYKRNPLVNIEKALLSLWKNELSELYLIMYKTQPKKKFNRNDLIFHISQKLSKNKLKTHLIEFLRNRYYNKSLQTKDM